MKSRDEIVIIMLQWLRLYTLGSRGSRELKTFLKTCLISSRVDQKLRTEKRVHGFFKGRIRTKIVGNWCGCGRGFAASRERFHLRGVVAPEFVTNFPQISLNGRHVCTTIGPRSRRDRATIVGRSVIASFQGNLPKLGEMIASFQGNLSARSGRDRGVLPRLVVAVQCSSGEGTVMIARSR